MSKLKSLGSENPFIGPEPACGISVGVAKKPVRDRKITDHKKILGILNRTQSGKRTHTRTLYQKNQETVKIKQKPVTVGGRTTNRILSLRRTHFQNRIDGLSYCERR
jgi:hypothetical protein